MLFKLSFSNFKKSLRDYSIYFFTLIIGVSVFYVFNAIGGQAAMMQMSESQYEIIHVLDMSISGTSVFVAGVLGFLIIYASRFLMKRRNKEFALYMLMGMSKRKISAILLVETIIIGIGSLFVGLIIGIGLSQLMSALVANLFEADMSAYKFIVSGEAILKTIAYFAVMYLITMIFNSVVVTKMKLIDLIQSGRHSEKIRLKSPVLCVILFLIAAASLGFAYYRVGWHSKDIERNEMIAYIIIGSIATFVIFWSVSGMLLRVMMGMKNVYYRGLNSFTFRQVSSKINTMVFSMTVICLMLFITICTCASAFSVRNSMNANLNELCPADFETVHNYDRSKDSTYSDIVEMCSQNGYDINNDFSEYVDFVTYSDPEFTMEDSMGEMLEEVKDNYLFLAYDTPETIVRLSDYNALMKLYGKDTFTLEDDEFILLCNFTSMTKLRNNILENVKELNICGHNLRSKYDECQDGFIDLSTERINAGLYVVPDSAVSKEYEDAEIFIGNYLSEDKEAAEKTVHDNFEAFHRKTAGETNVQGYMYTSKIEIRDASIGLGAVVTFLGLYIGMVFLIACGAILALKELSESVDSIGRYEMLRKIGAEEKEISGSLLRQTGIFFLIPLVLAVLHSIFGMKYSVFFLQFFGTENIWQSITATSIILLLIYGGYFLVTYYCSKGIIKERK